MANFGKRSKEKLELAHPDLKLIHNFVIEYFDHSVYESLRTDEKQLEYFLGGKSKLDPRNKTKRKKAKHLIQSDGFAHATDSAPYPIKFERAAKSKARFYMFAGYMFMASEILLKEGKITHKIRWGGDWDSDKDFKDQSFDDLPHFEIYKP